MSTQRLLIVAATLLTAAACTSSRAADSEPGVLGIAGARDAQQEKEKQSQSTRAAAKADFSIEGMFVDCCSCRPPCPCEVTEVMAGCRGVGAHRITRGTYAGEDLSGVTIAHAKVVGKWVNLYIDAKDEKQRAAAEQFGRAAFAAFGPIHDVKSAVIEISGADGSYAVTVDGGEIMKLETEPLLGGDGKTPIGYTNIKNAVNPTVYQATCVSASYSDGDKEVTVAKGRNSHFNAKLKSNGRI